MRTRHLARRLAQILPTMLGAFVLVFLVMRVLPGDPAIALLGTAATPDAVAALRRDLGVDRPVIVLCTLLVPAAILTEAMLSFLGLGITDPTPTWGNMIDNGRLVLREAPWLTIFPSAALVLTVIAFNLVGDAIRDALDPHVQDRASSSTSPAGRSPRATRTGCRPARSRSRRSTTSTGPASWPRTSRPRSSSAAPSCPP